MSVIDLQEAKAFLDVIHDADDAKLQLLLDAAEDEAAQFLNRDNLEDIDDVDTSNIMPGSVRIGVMLMLQANYQATPDDAEKLRRAAEVKLIPYRLEMGV